MADRWTIDFAYGEWSAAHAPGLHLVQTRGNLPERAANWEFIYDRCAALAVRVARAPGTRARRSGSGEAPRVLNLFAYTGVRRSRRGLRAPMSRMSIR